MSPPSVFLGIHQSTKEQQRASVNITKVYPVARLKLKGCVVADMPRSKRKDWGCKDTADNGISKSCKLAVRAEMPKLNSNILVVSQLKWVI